MAGRLSFGDVPRSEADAGDGIVYEDRSVAHIPAEHIHRELTGLGGDRSFRCASRGG
jgi:hypothetical protein